MSAADPPPPLDPTRLVAQAKWVRGLARRLVRDASDAEDLAQDVLLAGLEHPPQDPVDDRQLRGWLAGVARNLTRFRARSKARRADRERAAARRAIAPGTDDAVARAQEVRRLVDAVLSLEEPNRSAVLLAHLEGLSYRTIAKRLGTTPQNARKRVSRGLAQLRTRLAREDRRGPGNWVSGLALVLRLPTPLLTTAGYPTALIMSSKILVASLVCAVAILGIVGFLGFRTPAQSPGLHPDTQRAAQVSSDLAEVGSGGVGNEGRRPAGSLSGVARSAPPHAVPGTRRGSVRDAHDGRPVVGAELRTGLDPMTLVVGTTDSAGEFSLVDGSSLSEGFWVIHPETFELHVDRARIDNGLPLDLVVVGLGAVTVRAIDDAGSPAVAARIEYSIDPIHGSDEQMWRWRRNVAAGATNAQGVVHVSRLPVGTPLRFRFQREWLSSVETVIDPTTRRGEIEIVRPTLGSVYLRLVDANGGPVPDVGVSWHGTVQGSGDGRVFKSGLDGHVTISGIGPGHGGVVFAQHAHPPIQVQLAPGEIRALGTVVLAPSLEVSGTVNAVVGANPAGLYVTVFQAGMAGKSVVVQAGGAFHATAVDAPLTLVVTRRTRGWDPEQPFLGVPLARVDLPGPTAGVLIRLDAGGGVIAARLPRKAGAVPVAYEVLAEEGNVDWGPPHPRIAASGVAPTEAGLVVAGPIEPGIYDLVVQHPVLGTGMAAGLSVVTDFDTEIAEVVFGDGQLVLELEDAEGASASGVVFLRHHSDEKSSDRKGRPVKVAGRAERTLAPGGYSVRAELGGLKSPRWRHVRILPGEVSHVVLRAAASVVLAGRVTRGGLPVARLALSTQRHDPPTNLGWSATTNADGRFAFDPLLPGVYRVWASQEFVTTVTLAPGDTSTFEWELGGMPTRVEVRADGQLAAEVRSIQVCALEGKQALYTLLTRLEPGIFEGPLPEGPLFFDLGTTGLGVGDSFVAVGPPWRGGGSYVIDLARTGIEIVPSGPSLEVQPPVARLIEVAGSKRLSSWVAPVVLAHRTIDGRLVWPHIPAGAVVELEGLAHGAGRRKQTVRVGAAGWTRVTW